MCIRDRRCLTDSRVRTSAPEYQKWQAVSLANLEAAILCNHTKQVSASWASSRARYRERIAKAKERVDRAKIVLREANDALEDVYKRQGLAFPCPPFGLIPLP